ncbi:beta-glucosidase 12-like protein [Zopfochytrium polystomum]|nr:beta-glucosidase 12-like protein [Zopfochytrium polystomum]
MGVLLRICHLSLYRLQHIVLITSLSSIQPRPFNRNHNLKPTTTAAFQMEGAWNTNGKKASVADTFSQKNFNPWPNVAPDHYHHMPTDLAFLSQLGATAYRFSVAWSRVLPDCTGTPNEEGIQFYSDVIDNALANGAQPYLTMHHWDLPQACFDKYGGFTDPQIVDDFVAYATLLFDRFGDRVTYWLTQNEMESNCNFGYRDGKYGPGVVGGNTAKYKCLYHSHLIHGKVVQLARSKYAGKGWKFGAPSIMSYYTPKDPNNAADVAAATFMKNRDYGLFWEPSITGNYTNEVYTYPNDAASVVPFTAADAAIMKGTSDFIALNYYSAYTVDSSYNTGAPDGTVTSASSWQNVYAPGIRSVANDLYKRYSLDIHITEVGYATPGEVNLTSAAAVAADATGARQQFWSDHLQQVALTVADGVPVKALLAWSLTDNFEWWTFDIRYGCIAVNYTDGGAYQRTVKKPTQWLAAQLAGAVSPLGPLAAQKNASITVPGGSGGGTTPSGSATSKTVSSTGTSSKSGAAPAAAVAPGTVTAVVAVAAAAAAAAAVVAVL